jgi:hypothetical protein
MKLAARWMVGVATMLLLVPAAMAAAPLAPKAAGGTLPGTTTVCSTIVPDPLPKTVCASATANIAVTCTHARIAFTCSAAGDLGGSGVSDLMLPGEMDYMGSARGSFCDATRCLAWPATIAIDKEEWGGLVLSPNTAGSAMRYGIAGLTIDNPQPGMCITWGLHASMKTHAVALPIVVEQLDLDGQLDQVTAETIAEASGMECY